ncbi:MAG: hypothetical protein KA163_06945 [Bacteroidia bacterium]|nr:hypothetical protein [Bacteroidia bacterium]
MRYRFIITYLITFSTLLSVAQKVKEVSSSQFPCQGIEFNSDKNHLRGSGYAESSDPTIAREKAVILAKEALAASIKSQIDVVTTLYTKSTNNPQEYTKEFENINAETIDETIEGVNVICQKQEKLKNKNTKYYIACEIGTLPLITKIEEKVYSNKNLKVDFNKERFERIFNEEIEKLEKKQ